MANDPLASTTDGLAARVYAAPDDDAPRLVYADHLAQAGEKRGEFIALQIERAAGRGSEERSDAERALYLAHRAAFAGRLLSACDPKRGRGDRNFPVAFERGFPSRVHLGGKGLADVALAPEWGTVRAISGIEDAKVKGVRALLDGVHLRALDDVGVLSRTTVAGLKRPTYPWSRIAIPFFGLEPALAARFPSLTALRIGQRRSTHSIPRGFLGSFPRLRELELYPDTPVEAEILAEASGLTRLVAMGLGVAPEELRHLPLEDVHVSRRFDGWLDTFPSIRTLVTHAYLDVPAIRLRFDRHPNLERIHACTDLGGPGRHSKFASFERFQRGLRQVVRLAWLASVYGFPEFIADLRTSGVESVVATLPPRHLHAPSELTPERADAIREIVGDAFSYRQAL